MRTYRWRVRIPGLVRLAAAASALLLFGLATTAAAAPRGGVTVNVTIQNFVFTPRDLTLDPGDTIRWMNLDSAAHSAVSIKPGFVTLVLAQDQTTTTTFDRPGTFEYICGIHGVSMRGTIVVRGTPPETPRPSTALGHVVEDIFQEARPDVFVAAAFGGSPLLFASGALALIVFARVVWVLRHW